MKTDTGFTLSKRSARRLHGVHPLLCAIVSLSMLKYSKVDFGVAKDCVRTPERQRQLVDSGASKTMNSAHLIKETGFSHAVDLYPSGYAAISDITDAAWEDMAESMKMAAAELGVSITWGGDWKSFVDKPHFEIDA